jgi:hypothetical protein
MCFTGKFPDNTRLTAWMRESKFRVVALGTKDSVAETAEQLAWLGAALRSSPSDSQLAYCTPAIDIVHVPQNRSVSQSCIETFYKINFVVEEREENVELVNGQCWYNLFRNPVIVKGYPIPRRSEHDTGLEIPFDIMVRLAQAWHATTFGGKLFLKGFSTIMIPTKHLGDLVLWHMVFNELGNRISYTDPRIRNIPRATLKGVSLSDLKIARHVLGWCSHVKNYAGRGNFAQPIDRH